ncbi:MAG TPA: twin-arginine translocation signal domain-containing protein [Candidatus Bathyarchaeia archaeon]
MTNVYDFDQARRLWQNSASAQLDGSLDKNPDDVAKAFNYSKDTRVDPSTIHENLDEFEQDYKSGLASRLIRDNPTIASFINAHPLHAGLIHDDLGRLDQLTETLGKIHQSGGDSPLKQGVKGFAEGFGAQGFGHWQETLSPEMKALSEKYPISSQLWTLLGVPIEVGMRGFAGILQGAKATVKGVARQTGASDQSAESFANEMAGMLEFHLMGGGPQVPRAGELKSPKIEVAKVEEPDLIDPSRRSFLKGAAAAGAAAALPKGVIKGPLETLIPERLMDPETPQRIARQAIYSMGGDKQQALEYLLERAAKGKGFAAKASANAAEMIRSGWIDKLPSISQTMIEQTRSIDQALETIRREAQTLRPYLEAGEEPPAGVSDIVDKAKEEQAKLDQKALSDAVSDADSTALKERSPEKFREFLEPSPDVSIRISVEAIRKLYGDKVPEAGDNLLGWIPDLAIKLANEEAVGGGVEVSHKDFLTNIDKEVYKALKDDISLRDGASVNELKELGESKAGIEKPDPSDPALNSIRKGAGLEPPEKIMAAAKLEPPIEPPTVPPSSGEEPPSESSRNSRIFTSAKAFGRTEKELRKYNELIAKRDEEDVAWRAKRAERQAKLENSEAWKEEASSIRPEVREEIVSRSDVAAHQLFSEGKYVGQTLERKPKLARDNLTEEQINTLPPDMISSRGLHPDDVANMFGFSSGNDLVNSIAALEREAEGQRGDIVRRLVNAEVERRVQAKLGSSAADLLDEAKDHALSLTQMEMLHEQTLTLGTQLGVELPLSKSRMDWGAHNLLNEKRFGGLKSDRLLAEAGKAGRRVEKALLGDDTLEAFKAAQQQYTLAQMASGARAIEKEKKAFEKQAKTFSKREVDGIDPEYTNWVHDILIRVGRDVSRYQEDLRTEIAAQESKTLSDFLDKKEGMGYEISIPEFLVDSAFKKPLEDMSVRDARQVMNAVKSLIKAGRDEKKIGVTGERMDKKEFIAKAVQQLSELGEKATPEERAKQFGAPVIKLGRTFLAGTLQVESLLNRWDKGAAFGLFNNIIGRPMFEAANYRDKLAKSVAKEMVDKLHDKVNLKEVIPNTIFRDPISAYKPTPEDAGAMDWDNATPKAMTRQSLRVVLLNAGNEGNLKRLADGYGIKPEQVMDWLDRYATKKDWNWAQAYGDIFKNLKVLSDTAARQRSGVAPESIPILPIDSPHGQYPGWYWPIIKDPTFSSGLEKKSMGEPLFHDVYVRAGTAKGYTKDRTDHTAPISLDLDAIPGRLMQEIHDIAFRDAVMNASKVFYDRDFINAVTKFQGKEYGDTLIPWLKDVANSSNGKSTADATWSKWSEFFRQNVVGTLVGFNPRTIEKHTLSAAMNSFTEVGPREFSEAVQSLFRRDFSDTQTNWEFAYDKSEEIQRRSQNFVEQVSGAQEKVLDARSWRDTLLHAGTAPVAFGDMLSARPTWLAEFKKQIEAGRSEGDSIYAADRAVRRAHGSSAITNRPELMRRYPWAASLYGFFNHIANRQYELAWKAKEAAGLATKGEVEEAMSKVPSLAAGLFSYVIFPAIVEELVTPLTNDERESWAKKAAKGLIRGASSSWIGVRDFVNAALEAKDGTFGLASTLPKEFTDLARDLYKKDLGFDKAHAGKTIKHAMVAIGAVFGLANAQIGNLAEFLYDLKTGKQRPPKDLKSLWRGLSKGDEQAKSGPDLIERALPGKRRRQ